MRSAFGGGAQLFGSSGPPIHKSLDFRAGLISARPARDKLQSERAGRAFEALRDAHREVRTRAAPKDSSTDAIARQLTKSGTGQAANYHSARRARSRPEFIAKLGVAAEEADETEHWLGIIAGAAIVSTTAGVKELDWLSDESRQLRAILVASVRTARANYSKSKNTSSNP